ncbi:hypothetical protein KC19_VG040500 [Ceratodon purpureus]|uniref:Uncharacterized protein n=1 Tax=Ceratodon purpureus TaxID=3225 RepID=A0A8T0HLU2_CERPU|nr:hypothetical protein KC19_VG040500 [Ceratodon purpureus]
MRDKNSNKNSLIIKNLYFFMLKNPLGIVRCHKEGGKLLTRRSPSRTRQSLRPAAHHNYTAQNESSRCDPLVPRSRPKLSLINFTPLRH